LILFFSSLSLYFFLFVCFLIYFFFHTTYQPYYLPLNVLITIMYIELSNSYPFPPKKQKRVYNLFIFFKSLDFPITTITTHSIIDCVVYFTINPFLRPYSVYHIKMINLYITNHSFFLYFYIFAINFYSLCFIKKIQIGKLEKKIEKNEKNRFGD